ncbi:MAG: hypothetical protein HWN66_20235 [Candidatus Helarchaeota archaeon]|nr:hypothetical protein [Candidatus Helarchaeota archaeon]
MAAPEPKTNEAVGTEVKKSKYYYLSSLIIIIAFVIVNIIGLFLKIMDLLGLIILFSLFFGVTVIIIGYSDRLERVYIEKWGQTFRKYSHLVGGFILIFFGILSVIQLSWICLSLFISFLIHEYFYVKKNISGIYTKTLIFVGRLDRRYNPESPGEPRPFYSSLWLLAAISLIGLFGQNVAIAAIITFALGDTLSTLVGERIGKHKLPYNKTKSVEGTLVFFGITFLGVFFAFIWSGHLYWLPALISASVGCISESLIPTNYWLDDNFVVPVSVGVVLYLTRVF